jgi:hypothetical protein
VSITKLRPNPARSTERIASAGGEIIGINDSTKIHYYQLDIGLRHMQCGKNRHGAKWSLFCQVGLVVPSGVSCAAKHTHVAADAIRHRVGNAARLRRHLAGPPEMLAIWRRRAGDAVEHLRLVAGRHLRTGASIHASKAA